LAAQHLFTYLGEPTQGIAQEVSLVRHESRDLLAFLVLLCLLESIKTDQQATIVGDVFAQAGAAINMYSRQRLIGIELLGHKVSAFLKFRSVFCAPPLYKIAKIIILATFIIEAMGNFVSNCACARISISQRIIDIRIFHSWYFKDGGRQNNLIIGGIVVGIIG